VNVLIADGSGAIAAPGIVLLTLWGHVVETALDGLEALRKVRARAPDLVLASLALDRMDGLSLTAALRANPATRHVQVVLATGAEDVQGRKRIAEVGADGFVVSPLDAPGLLRALAGLGLRSRASAARVSR
jgi:two-component system chemotaxis response regulator CheY